MEINIVTAIIALIMITALLKGIYKNFSDEAVFNTLIQDINGILFAISLVFSIYFIRRVFADGDKEGIYSSIYGIIPQNVLSYISDAGILFYLIAVPPVMLAVFLILAYIRSFLDNLMWPAVKALCSSIRKTHRGVRAFTGVLIELPKAVLTSTALVLIISLLPLYYPMNPISLEASRSSLYNYIYNNALLPVLSSGPGQKIPVFLQSSVEEISKGIGESKILSDSEAFKSLGFVRFQYETKSNEEIDAMARKIIGKETDDRQKAYLLYKWVGSNIEYDWEKYNNILNNTAKEDKFGAIPAFNTRYGVCEDYADLYVAMAKAVGLKVRIIVGQGYSMESWGGHAWNEVYLPSENRWVPLDATWAKTGDYFDNKDFYDDHTFEAIAGEW